MPYIGGWTFQVKLLAPDAVAGDKFGRSASMTNGVLIIGAHNVHGEASDSGAPVLYRHVYIVVLTMGVDRCLLYISPRGGRLDALQ